MESRGRSCVAQLEIGAGKHIRTHEKRSSEVDGVVAAKVAGSPGFRIQETHIDGPPIEGRLKK